MECSGTSSLNHPPSPPKPGTQTTLLGLQMLDTQGKREAPVRRPLTDGNVGCCHRVESVSRVQERRETRQGTAQRLTPNKCQNSAAYNACCEAVKGGHSAAWQPQGSPRLHRDLCTNKRRRRRDNKAEQMASSSVHSPPHLVDCNTKGRAGRGA